MGLLSNIVGAVKQSVVGKALDFTTVAFTQPIETVKAVIKGGGALKELEQKSFAQPLSKQITSTVLATIGYGTAVVAGGAIATKGIAGTAAALIPATTKGKVVAAIATPIVAGAVIKQPAASIKLVSKAPSELAQFGADVSTFATNPSLESAKQIIKESPVISAGAGLLLAGGAIKTLAPAIATARQTEAIQEQTQAMKAEKQFSIMPVTPTAQIKEIPATSTTPTPQVAETKTISKETPIKKRRKAQVKQKPISMNQRVNVIVSNNSSTKKYLNRIVLAH